MEDFVFPSSRLMLHLQKTGQLSQDQAIPVCTTPGTLTMAFDFLVALCVECVHNMRLLVDMLSEMFYSGKINFSIKATTVCVLFQLSNYHD